MGIKARAGERPALWCDELSPETIIFGICAILEGVGEGSAGVLRNGSKLVCFSSHMERMGATESSDAMRMPLSQMQAVSRRDHVGSPLAFPWPKICRNSTDIFKMTQQKI